MLSHRENAAALVAKCVFDDKAAQSHDFSTDMT